MTPRRPRPPSGDVLVLATVSIWSVNVIVVKVALRDCAPLLYTAARFLLGGALLLAALRLTRTGWRLPRRQVVPVVMAGLLGIAANQTAFTVALRYTTAVDVSLIIGATPLAVAIHGALTARERIGRRTWAGLALGAAGLVVVVGAGGGAHGALGGDLIALGAPIVWAFYLARLVDILKSQPALRVSGWVTLSGALILLPVGVSEGITAPPHMSWHLLGLLAFSSVLAVTFCNAAYLEGLQRLGPTRTAVYTYLQPFLGAVVAFLVLGEALRPLQLAGGVVVVAGVVVGRAPPAPAGAEPAAAAVRSGAGTARPPAAR